MSESVIIEQDRGRLQNAATHLTRLKRYFTGDLEGRVRSLYELNDRKITGRSLYRDFLAIKTLYLNYGYWATGAADQDEASEALADLLAETVGISAGDRVLDCGFGYAEQDIRWARTREPQRIVGVNVTNAQVEVARKRVADLGLADVIDLRIGSATDVPLGAASTDRVVALESALHFNTRQRFFEEAHRVLRPGGTIATADLVPVLVGSSKPGPVQWLEHWVRDKVVPPDNWYTMETYAERMRQAGFVDVDVKSITAEVILPRVEFTRRRFAAPENRRLTARQRFKMRLFLWIAERRVGSREYILAFGRKPE
ncbi:SAM-dependent methyltransferase [Streptomyces phaeochromogenes]|uniref:SAM-dependent methyltransferase n=1 Tax=Streptomyces phaeochromogenes TaxID=1923 RepID=UPI0036B3E34A